MAKHLVVGSGPVGTSTARMLAERGDDVTLANRSGAGPELADVRRVRLDASDSSALSELAAGSAVLYNCAAPAYHRWAGEWPPLANSLLVAAERSGAVLATVGNLYAYGAVTAPMTETTPLNATSVKGRVRARMWLDALAWHDSGRIRATEIRSCDYVGPGVLSQLGDRVFPRVLAGKTVRVMKSADTPHSWTYTEDVARLLIVVGGQERAWGKAWHVPTNPPRTQREAVGDIARVANVRPVAVSEIPAVMLRAIGMFSPTVRQLREVAYQLEQPFIIDSTAAQATFALEPTTWDNALAATITSYQRA